MPRVASIHWRLSISSRLWSSLSSTRPGKPSSSPTRRFFRRQAIRFGVSAPWPLTSIPLWARMRSSRTAVVTGSSRGIGRDVVVQLLERGYSVIGCARGETDLQHDRYHHFRVDVADDASVRGMFGEI